MKLLFASNNPGKVREVRSLLDDLDLEILTPNELGIALHVEESGVTYRENAALKAQAFAEASQLVTMADDSGLEVDALGGAPGLYSARYAPQPGAGDADRRAYLLEKLKEKNKPWQAQFCCVICLVTSTDQTYFFDGYCPGEIIPEERGRNGFGYDPIFLIPELGRTMAELSMQEKNQLSHRARAVKAARPFLRGLLENRAKTRG